jgi:hypothetical protein
MATVNPNTNTCHRVRIKNIKSQRYMSIERPYDNWKNYDASLTIDDWLPISPEPILSSSQVWTILRSRAESYLLINQISGDFAGIRGRGTGNGDTASQYYSQLQVPEQFQQWKFQPYGNVWLIQNVNSRKFIGPHARSTEPNTYLIQWDDQTREDSYQEWEFEPI